MNIGDTITAMDWVTHFSKVLHDARYLFQVRQMCFPDDVTRGKTPEHIPWDWTMADVTKMLSENGIENWGHYIFDNRAYLTVKKRDYDRAIRMIQQTVMNPRSKPQRGPFRFVQLVFQDKFAWLIWALFVVGVAGVLFMRFFS